jgi:hypothetical protein
MYSMPTCGSRSRAGCRGCAQLHEPAALAAEGAGGELAVEVPQRQAVRLDLEVGVAALAVLQRVGVGHHVAAHAVGVDQLEDPGLLADLVVVAGRDVLGPADRLVGDAQGSEDLVVEAVLAQQQTVHPLEELADWRPWMTRWSYVEVSVMTLLTALRVSVSSEAPWYSGG